MPKKFNINGTITQVECFAEALGGRINPVFPRRPMTAIEFTKQKL